MACTASKVLPEGFGGRPYRPRTGLQTVRAATRLAPAPAGRPFPPDARRGVACMCVCGAGAGARGRQCRPPGRRCAGVPRTALPSAVLFPAGAALRFMLLMACSGGRGKAADQLLSGPFGAVKRFAFREGEPESSQHIENMSFAQELVMMPPFPRESAVRQRALLARAPALRRRRPRSPTALKEAVLFVSGAAGSGQGDPHQDYLEFLDGRQRAAFRSVGQSFPVLRPGIDPRKRFGQLPRRPSQSSFSPRPAAAQRGGPPSRSRPPLIHLLSCSRCANVTRCASSRSQCKATRVLWRRTLWTKPQPGLLLAPSRPGPRHRRYSPSSTSNSKSTCTARRRNLPKLACTLNVSHCVDISTLNEPAFFALKLQSTPDAGKCCPVLPA